MDVVIAESKKAGKGKANQIQKLKKYLKTLERKYENVIIILNNPCLEFWFILHFKQTTKYFSKCSDAEKQLKKQLKDYEKTQKYFTKHNDDIYLKLKSKLKTAITNAQKTKRKNLDAIENGICEMNLFFEAEQINKILN